METKLNQNDGKTTQKPANKKFKISNNSRHQLVQGSGRQKHRATNHADKTKKTSANNYQRRITLANKIKVKTKRRVQNNYQTYMETKMQENTTTQKTANKGIASTQPPSQEGIVSIVIRALLLRIS